MPATKSDGWLEAEVENLKRETGVQRDDIGQLFELVRGVTKDVATANAGISRIEGTLAGALQAKRSIWPVIAALLTAATALLVALMKAYGGAP
jgi:hypothetical protein